ncbi:hypothetical protein GOODEAATRI_021139, partial [Goodea atripinnis]
FGNVEVTVTFLKDEFGIKVLQYLKREELLALVVCIVGLVLGIPHVSKGGIYVFQLMDHCTAVVSLIWLAFSEVVTVCWIFGKCILGSSIVQYTPPRYGKYIYPVWAKLVGWVISLVSIVWIPLCAIHEIYNSKGSLLQRIKQAVTPTLDLDALDPQPEKQNLDEPALEKLLSSSV